MQDMTYVSLSLWRLKPFTSYQFRIKATNDIGDSEYSQESEAITTLQDGKNHWQHHSHCARIFYSAFVIGVNMPLHQCFDFTANALC